MKATQSKEMLEQLPATKLDIFDLNTKLMETRMQIRGDLRSAVGRVFLIVFGLTAFNFVLFLWYKDWP